MVKMYDPYYIVDPTNPTPSPVQDRTASGRFGMKSSMSHPDWELSVPINANWWRNGANMAIVEICELTNPSDDELDGLWKLMFGDKPENFSWRMIFEMLDAAREQARKDPKDIQAIVTAAHAWLLDRQKEIPDEATRASNNFNWDLIPEVPF